MSPQGSDALSPTGTMWGGPQFPSTVTGSRSSQATQGFLVAFGGNLEEEGPGGIPDC